MSLLLCCLPDPDQAANQETVLKKCNGAVYKPTNDSPDLRSNFRSLVIRHQRPQDIISSFDLVSRPFLLSSFFFWALFGNLRSLGKGGTEWKGREWWGGIESPIVNLLSELPSSLNYKASRMTGRV